MTKASATRKAGKAARKKIADEAISVACHGRLIEVDVDGVPVKFWAMPAKAHQVVVSALQVLSR